MPSVIENQDSSSNIIPSTLPVTPQEFARYKKFYDEHVKQELYNLEQSLENIFTEDKIIKAQNNKKITLEKKCGSKDDEKSFYQKYYNMYINQNRGKYDATTILDFASMYSNRLDRTVINMVIDLEIAKILSKNIQEGRLIILYFQNCFFETGVIEQISMACRNSKIQKLHFSNSQNTIYKHQINSFEVNILLNSLINHQTLTSLVLEDEELSNESFEYSSQLLLQNENLKELCLSNNQIYDQNIELILEPLKQRKSFIKINLHNYDLDKNNISQDMLEKLYQVMLENKNIVIECSIKSHIKTPKGIIAKPGAQELNKNIKELSSERLKAYNEKIAAQKENDSKVQKANLQVTKQVVDNEKKEAQAGLTIIQNKEEDVTKKQEKIEIETKDETIKEEEKTKQIETQKAEEKHFTSLAVKRAEERKEQEERDKERDKALALHQHNNHIKPLFITSGIFTLAAAGLFAIYKSYTKKLDNKLASRINLGVAIASFAVGGGLFATALYKCAKSQSYTNKLDDEKKVNSEIKTGVETTL